MYLEKPVDYAKYAYHRPHKIPRALWPEDCKKYAVYLDMIKRHPDWKDLTEEEIEKEKLKLKQEQAEKMRNAVKEKLSKMTPEEIKEFNKKKGSFYQNMTEEEKLKHNEVLRNRSNKFWGGMNEDQKKEFSQYRENKWSESAKQNRVARSIDLLKKYRETLTPEDIAAQVKKMNDGYRIKFENDKEFREKQIALLRKHNEEYWNSLTDEQKHAIWDKNGKHLGDLIKEKWKDAKYREEQTKFLREHASDYVNSLSEEELKKHAERLNAKNAKHRDSMSQEEKEKFFKATILNHKFEKLFHEHDLDSKYHYVREYEVRHDVMHFKIWDYAIYNKHDELVAVVDLDGEFNHGIECDYNGLQCSEERDAKRGFFIPENSKAYIFNPFLFEDEFKEFYNTLEMNRDEYIRFVFSKYTSMKFPYPHYATSELIYSMNRLIAMNTGNKSYRKYTNQREGDKLIHNYHQSIWKEHVDGKISPYELWNDKDKLIEEMYNGTFYRDCVDANKISQQFLLSSIAPKIPIFSAGKARILIDRYLKEFDIIFDPFSGYSGIMLGAVASMKKYIGQDESYIKIKESNRLIDFLKMSKINYPDITIPVNEQKEFKSSRGSYECMFTYLYQHDSDDVIDKCLEQFKCKKYVFVVSSTEKYKDKISEDIIYRTHFGDRHEYVIVIE